MLVNTNKETSDFKEMQKLLADPEEKKVIDLIRYLSPDCEFVKKEHEYGIQLEKKQHADEYGLIVINKADIRKELVKYNLHFYNSTNFTGEYDLDFVKKMNETIVNNRLNKVDGDTFRESLFFISEKENDKSLEGQNSNPIKLALYKLPEKNGYYAILNKNSDYATMINYYKGIKNYSSFQMRLCFLLETFISLLLLYVFFYKADFVSTTGILSVVGMFFISAIISVIRMGLRESHKDEFDHYQSYFLEYYNNKTNGLSD